MTIIPVHHSKGAWVPHFRGVMLSQPSGSPPSPDDHAREGGLRGTTMNTLKFATILLLIAASCVLADIVPDPAARAVGAADTQTYRLYQRLVGSASSYAYRGRIYRDLTFTQGGAIQFKPWQGATWRITSPNSVAIRHEKLGEMSVHFNGEFKKFIAKDWGGGNATGTLQEPNAKAQ